jgi:hypothetical protein
VNAKPIKLIVCGGPAQPTRTAGRSRSSAPIRRPLGPAFGRCKRAEITMRLQHRGSVRAFSSYGQERPFSGSSTFSLDAIWGPTAPPARAVKNT